MKLVYVANTILPSKKANSLQTMKMCEAFARIGHETYLLLPKIANQQIDPFEYYDIPPLFEIIRCPFPGVKGKNIIYGLHEAKQVLRMNPDIVYGRCLFGCTHAAWMGYPVIFETHIPVWQNSPLTSLYFKALSVSKNLKRVVLISKALKEYFMEHSSLPADKLLPAHSGASEIKQGKEIEEVQWPGRPQCLQLGYTGHLYPGKGIEIIENLAEHIDDVDFHIIGGFSQDINFWQDRIKNKNVHFHGFLTQPKLNGCFKHLDVCLLPNQRSVSASSTMNSKDVDIGEFTSPMKLFEYMAHGKAIVASDLPQLREVLNDSNACLVCPDDISQWIAAIIKMKTDARLRKQIANSAYNDFLNNYSWIKRAEYVLRSISI
jgi:glycosyltransferase involved in cell wall biosynthesis